MGRGVTWPAETAPVRKRKFAVVQTIDETGPTMCFIATFVLSRNYYSP
jgi:hypothetical protein